jgi:hypothetical protein
VGNASTKKKEFACIIGGLSLIFIKLEQREGFFIFGGNGNTLLGAHDADVGVRTEGNPGAN